MSRPVPACCGSPGRGQTTLFLPEAPAHLKSFLCPSSLLYFWAKDPNSLSAAVALGAGSGPWLSGDCPLHSRSVGHLWDVPVLTVAVRSNLPHLPARRTNPPHLSFGSLFPSESCPCPPEPPRPAALSFPCLTPALPGRHQGLDSGSQKRFHLFIFACQRNVSERLLAAQTS